MSITWCVVHTQPLKEMTAKQNLEAQGFEVYLPRFKKTVRHARKVEEKLSPLFPRYLFVGMDMETAQWRSINGTRGVSYLLMADDLNPSVVPPSIIEELRFQETADGLVPVSSLSTFTKGDKLLVVDGSFKDQIAIFDGLDDKNRIQILLNFLGREVRVALPEYAVEAA